MRYGYRCRSCGELELDRAGVTQCPLCGGALRRQYTVMYMISRRGWTDIPPEARYENWSPEEKRMTLERGA